MFTAQGFVMQALRHIGERLAAAIAWCLMRLWGKR